MDPVLVLWIYIIMLVAGGVMGYVKAKSRISLIASLGFAIPLSLTAMDVIPEPIVADILLMILTVFFGLRFIKGKKFMPGGLMTILSILALALRHINFG
jgi:uncharacterized membrane protein (UPF0136 family)